MSGHSKWATIHRQKEVNDAKRGQLFGNLTRAITIAAKTGGGDPDTNYKLRMAIDKAKEANMPKANIDRAITSAEQSGSLEEITYEGYGPGGIAVVVVVATDNRNRTGQEIKNLFESRGGSLGKPGAVSFNFENKGQLIVDVGRDVEEVMLAVIDAGAEDVEEDEDGVVAYVEPAGLSELRGAVDSKGMKVISSELVMRPKQLNVLGDQLVASKAFKFLEELTELDDVQKVFSNFDTPAGMDLE